MKILSTLIITATLFFGSITSENDTKITVTVPNVTSSTGKVHFALFNKKEQFLKIPIQTKSAEIVEGKSTIVFEGISSGEYAVTCYHDKNDNGKMDFEANGMPLEDYGASNNTMSFGPPQYHDAKFEVTDKNVSLEIRL